MSNIVRVSLSEIASLPAHDVFLCCSSFEDRCLTVASLLSHKSCNVALICHYYGPNHKSDENFYRLQEMFKGNNVEIQLKKNNPLSNYDELFESLAHHRPKSVLFDISTLTRETLLIALLLFRQNPFSDIQVTMVYVPAAGYSSLGKQSDITNIWLSRGVYKVRSVLGYSGYQSAMKKTMLIVLVGFETERARILIGNFEPDKLCLGYAPPAKSHSEEFAKINKESFENLAASESECLRFEFSCIDILHTKEVLCDIIKANKDEYNIIISPMNNKLSSIAVGLAAFEYPEVQVCYASTNQYNTEAYSSPADYAYLYK